MNHEHSFVNNSTPPFMHSQRAMIYLENKKLELRSDKREIDKGYVGETVGLLNVKYDCVRHSRVVAIVFE